MKELTDLILSNSYENISHEDTLSKHLQTAKIIEIVCPFISIVGAQWLLNTKNQDSKIVVITELSVKGIISGVQSIEALRLLLNAGCEIHFLTSGLHAKLYWFDGKEAVITSANLTENGLKKNFELGISIGPGILNESLVKGGTKAFAERVRALFIFIKSRAEILTEDHLQSFQQVDDRSKDLRQSFENLEKDFSELTPEVPYIPFQRPLQNRQTLSTDLMMTNMFEGFSEKHWDIFHHEMEVSQENLNHFRHQLDDKINPLLYSFYTQLKQEPIFKKNFSVLEFGFSKNQLLRQRFPHDRYLFLTKPRAGKPARRHLGEPSIIISLGKTSQDTGWLEVRSGVEEDTLSELSEAGDRLISRIVSNLDESSRRLKTLGQGWELSHGSFSKDKHSYLPINSLIPAQIKNEISPYLESREVSDLQIRRKYFLNNPVDREILLSPKITQVIAQDIESLVYFFNLAHK